MGCPSQVTLGNNLVFSVTTHDPATAVLTDADAVPSYRVYEDETAVPILTGNMAKLDDVNTTGFYTEQIACTSANGFEASKTYTVYIEATVDGDTGAICYGFNVAGALVAGAIEYTYTITRTDTGLPLDGVDVWVSTDVAGLNIVWVGSTDTFGVARDTSGVLPWLDAGTYYFWRHKAGFTFVEPDVEVVS